MQHAVCTALKSPSIVAVPKVRHSQKMVWLYVHVQWHVYGELVFLPEAEARITDVKEIEVRSLTS